MPTRTGPRPCGSAIFARHQHARGTRTAGCASTRCRARWVDVEVGGGAVAIKIGHRDGVIVQVTPEFDDVAALARRLGRPERQVLDERAAAAAAAGLVVGAPLPPP